MKMASGSRASSCLIALLRECRGARYLPFYGDVDDVFLVEFVVVEEVADGIGLGFFRDGGEFFGEVAAFEVKDAVWELVEAGALYFFADPVHELRELGDGAGDDEVHLAVNFFDAAVEGDGVGEAEAFDAVLHDFDFLADRVDEEEAGFGEGNGEGDAGETAAGADVDDGGVRLEGHDLGDGEGVENVALGEVFDVGARNEVYLAVPLCDELGVLGELCDLLRGEFGQVFGDDGKVEVHRKLGKERSNLAGGETKEG